MTAETTQKWMRALGGRRFLLTLGAGVVHTVLVWFGKLTGGEYVTVTTLTVAAYITGATYQKGKEIAKAD